MIESDASGLSESRQPSELEEVIARAGVLRQRMMNASAAQTDRLFAWLMGVQWVAAVALAYWLSPTVWAGDQSATHAHVYAALILGGLISSLPWFAIYRAPGSLSSRTAVAIAQMLWSGLLVHLTGGRIETHFHIFGSLAFLASYRDARVLLPATLVTAADHFLRGYIWPESIYGVANPEWWRSFEHAGWVIFCDVFLVMQSLRSEKELGSIALRQAETEYLRDEERAAKDALRAALTELEDAQETMMRTERLAAVGQLAAGVGHELRNPLAAIRNAHTFIGKKIDRAKETPLASDSKVTQFRKIIDRELAACSKIISDLLDFARARKPVTNPVHTRGLIAECFGIVPALEHVTLVNEIADDFPQLEVDKDQVRQVFVNLIQNASEAMPNQSVGTVTVAASVDSLNTISISVVDDGDGIESDKLKKIFQPLFSTKTKGTGLGLAIVQQMVERHGGRISVESEVGVGTRFLVEFPSEGVTLSPLPSTALIPAAS